MEAVLQASLDKRWRASTAFHKATAGAKVAMETRAVQEEPAAAERADAMTTHNFQQGQSGAKGTGGAAGSNDGIAGPTGILLAAP